MYKDLEINFAEYFKLPNSRLRSMFGRIKAGQPNEYRTTFYNSKEFPKRRKTLSQILDDWMPALDQLNNKWPGLVKFEKDLAKKVGPMSIMKPLKERMEDIDSYYDSILLESTPLSPASIEAVIKEWGSHRGLRLRGQQKTVELMKKSTSSGSPFWKKRRDVILETVPCDMLRTFRDNKYPDIIQELSAGAWHACSVLGWRGQEGGPSADDVKQRVVFMFPFAVNVSELQLYQPLIEVAQRSNIVPAWVSMDAVDERITRLFDTKNPHDMIVCTDFTRFDQHFNSDLQHASRQIIEALMTSGSESSQWLDNIFPIKYEIPLAFEWGKMRYGAHGMGSGSGGTNADETLAHRALQYEAALSHRKILNPNSMCLGDDGILTFPGITAKDVMESYVQHGLDMNLDKQEESLHECTFLRRWHHARYRVDGRCVGVYSTCRALGRLAEQERWYPEDIWGPEMVALRQLSILENVKYHPLREEFAEYCMKGDKYRLGIDLPGFLDNIVSAAKKAIDVMPDFLGYTKSMQMASNDVAGGIQNWWIVQYLRKYK